MPDYDEDGNEIENENKPNFRRQLEQDAKDAKARAEAAENQVKELMEFRKVQTFKDAGIDTTQGPGKLLASTYSGDLTFEAIKGAAAEYGIIPKEEQTLNDEANRLAGIGQAGSGSTTGNEEDIFEEIKKMSDLDTILAKARSLGIPISDEKPGVVAPLRFQ